MTCGPGAPQWGTGQWVLSRHPGCVPSSAPHRFAQMDRSSRGTFHASSDPAGFARDGPEVHDVAAVHRRDRGVPSAPPGDAGEWDGAGYGVQFGVEATRWTTYDQSVERRRWRSSIRGGRRRRRGDSPSEVDRLLGRRSPRTTTSAPDADAAASDSASDAAKRRSHHVGTDRRKHELTNMMRTHGSGGR